MTKSYLDDAIIFNDNLNPLLWDQDADIKSEILVGLLDMAKEFQDFLNIDDLDLVDITISGSNAAYTYTPHSDIDLHLVVNIPENIESLYRELFDAKKNLYNSTHDQKIKGMEVEFYVQGAKDEVESLGIFSVLRRKWISFPRKVKATVDDTNVKNRVSTFKARIEQALASDDHTLAQKTWKDFRAMRKAGLERAGEFSPENLAFKILRTQGYQDSLYNHITSLRDRELSVESLQEGPQDPITYEVLPGTMFYDQYVDGETRKRVKYLSTGYRDIDSETDFVALKGAEVLGVLGIEKSPYERDVIWMKFVSVDANYRGKGVAKKLIEMFFQHAVENKQRIKISSYSEMGEQYLRKVFDHYRGLHPELEVKDGDDHTAFTP